MANIHRLNDYNGQQGAYQNMQPGYSVNPLMTDPNDDPRKENFLTMLIRSLCPRVQLISFTTALVLIISVLYFTMLGLGGPAKIDGNYSFLIVQYQQFSNFGGNDIGEVKRNGSVYLWFSSVFLTFQFMSWVSNCLFILIICSRIEEQIGTTNTMIIYIFGGACGAMFGSVTQCCSSLPIYSEVDSGIDALFGALLAMLMLYWSRLAILGPFRYMIVCFVIYYLFIIILMATSNRNGVLIATDYVGNVGGVLGGLFIGLSIIQVQGNGEFEKRAKMLGMGFLALFVGLCVIIFFTLHY